MEVDEEGRDVDGEDEEKDGKGDEDGDDIPDDLNLDNAQEVYVKMVNELILMRAELSATNVACISADRFFKEKFQHKRYFFELTDPCSRSVSLSDEVLAALKLQALHGCSPCFFFVSITNVT